MTKIMMIMVMMATIVTSASAMTKSEARNEAAFLTDRMARELSLSRMQYDAVYEINYDYMRSMSHNGTVSASSHARRNAELQRVLTASQYNKYVALHKAHRAPARPVYNWHSHHKAPAPHHGHKVVVVRR